MSHPPPKLTRQHLYEGQHWVADVGSRQIIVIDGERLLYETETGSRRWVGIQTFLTWARERGEQLVANNS